MEAAGADPDLNGLVQAECSPEEVQQYQCDAGCFNRPNFNTFRYAIAGQGSTVAGPNGLATDLGNVDITDPNQVKTFINYANLWHDPADFQPTYDLAYRYDQNANFSLFHGAGSQPTLSLTTSHLSRRRPRPSRQLSPRARCRGWAGMGRA